MATIHDVALHAGVSPTTVSRYLNNRIELPAATSARIDAAIARFNYRPNVLAKRLSTGRTEAIGLILPDIREPFFAELASAIEDEADRHGYTILMASTRGERARELTLFGRMADQHVDGLILLTNTPDDGTLAKLVGTRPNVVLVDEDVPTAVVPRIFVDNAEGARRATRCLIQAGHRHIGYLGGALGLLSSEERRAGFTQAMDEAGLAIDPAHVRLGSFSPDFAHRAVLSFLHTPTPPTAIFAASGYLAIGALHGLREAGVAMPGDMSLIGFDDVPMGALLSPPLTVIRQPIEALGRRGFQALLALINRGTPPPPLTRLPVELIERGSVARPRAGSLSG